MRVIKPFDITDSKLTLSSIPEPDSSVGEIAWTAYTSTIGDRRVVVATHRIYEAVAATADDPVTGAAKAVPTWVDVAPSNKWAMFDAVVGTQSTDNLTLSCRITPNELTNSIAGFNITGALNVNVTVVSASSGTVYNRDIDMIDNSNVIDFYTYFFEPIISVTEFIITDLPAFTDTYIDTTITGGGALGCGALVVGRQNTLGVALYGSSWQSLDFSRKERDEFGNFNIIRRATVDRFEYDVVVDRHLFSYVKNTLKSLSTVACVWAGTENTNDGTVVFGYYVDTQINLSSPSKLNATITVEGIV